MELIDAFILDAIRKGADNVVVSEDDVDPESNTIKFVAVKC